MKKKRRDKFVAWMEDGARKGPRRLNFGKLK